MKFDYCIAVATENEIQALKMHLNSLKHYCGMEMFNLLIGTSITLPQWAGATVGIAPYKQEATTSLNLAGYDFCNKIHRLIGMGSEEWIIVSHADIIYRKSILDATKNLLGEQTGMVGIWPHGQVIIRRKAFETCHMGFWPLVNVYIEGDSNLTGWMQHSPGSRQVASPDVGDLLRIEMQGYGWKYERAPLLGSDIYFHAGGQSGHTLLTLPENQRNGWKVRLEEYMQQAITEFGQFR